MLIGDGPDSEPLSVTIDYQIVDEREQCDAARQLLIASSAVSQCAVPNRRTRLIHAASTDEGMSRRKQARPSRAHLEDELVQASLRINPVGTLVDAASKSL